MPLPTRGRAQYNPVSSTDLEDDDDVVTNTSTATAVTTTTTTTGTTQFDDGSLSTTTSSNNASAAGVTLSTSSSSRRRQQSQRDNERIFKEDTPLKADDSIQNNSNSNSSNNNKNQNNNNKKSNDIEKYENDQGERVNVVILDSAQKRFPISANPDWTVAVFKRIGFKTHKVAPSSQRLIFRGKMLDDSKSLRDVGIHTDDLIVHLFPKPRVVVTSSNSNVTAGSNNQNNSSSNAGDANAESQSGGGGGGGAHIPQIILDEEEQQRRGQILVLGSHEIAEAQNNVKLLSLLLLVVCAMRLMALFSIAMGVAQEPVYVDDDINGPNGAHGNNGNNSTGNGGTTTYPDQYQVRPWEFQDYFDLIVSSIGFYVATLGMKATTENTLRLANSYLIGTVIAGISWNVWNAWMYLLFVQEETAPKDDDEMIPLTRDDFITVAFFTVMLPLLVWWMCCMRAWQFRVLIAEAEIEAAERIQSQLRLTETGPSGLDEDDGDDDNENNNNNNGTSNSNNEGRLTELTSNVSIV